MNLVWFFGRRGLIDEFLSFLYGEFLDGWEKEILYEER
jgi:hypothetical protein